MIDVVRAPSRSTCTEGAGLWRLWDATRTVPGPQRGCRVGPQPRGHHLGRVPFHGAVGGKWLRKGWRPSRFDCCRVCVCQRVSRQPRRPHAPPSSVVCETSSFGRGDLVVLRNRKPLPPLGRALCAPRRPSCPGSRRVPQLPLGGGGDPHVISGRNASVRSHRPVCGLCQLPAITTTRKTDVHVTRAGGPRGMRGQQWRMWASGDWPASRGVLLPPCDSQARDTWGVGAPRPV